MISKLALLANLLFVSVALAVPSTTRGARLAHRHEIWQRQIIDRIVLPPKVEYSTNTAGAAWSGVNGTFTTITGTFAIPVSTSTSDSLSIWVGIDGGDCEDAILQTGVDILIDDEEPSYEAWYEWYPDYAYSFSGITISSGDVINATIVVTSTTSATVSIENLTTGQTATQDVTSSYALCEQATEWILEVLGVENSLTGLPGSFGPVTITNATASGPSGEIYTPAGASSIIMISGCGTDDVTTEGDTLTIECTSEDD